jgi:phosphonate transport system permease protein
VSVRQKPAPALPGQIAPPRGPVLAGRLALPSLRFALLVLVLAVVYGYAWKITKIDLVQLVTGAPQMRTIVMGLLTPDLIERVYDVTIYEAPLLVREQAAAQSTAGGAVTVTPAQAMPGGDVEVRGQGLPPGAQVQLEVVSRTGDARRAGRYQIRPDGSFEAAFELPRSFAIGDYTVRATVARPLNQWRPSETLKLTAEKMVETIFLALMGTTLSVILTVPLSFLGARNLMSGSPLARAVYYATRTLFNVLRSIEILIIAVIMAVVVGIGPFAGVMALVIHSIGALGKLYSEAIESIDHGPVEAIVATGATPLQVVRYAVVPQILPQFVAFTVYRWDINVRMSTVIGLVGGGGIGFILTQYIQLFKWHQAGTAIWLITLTVMAMDYFSAIVREKMA